MVYLKFRDTLPCCKFNLTEIQIVRKHLQLYSNIFRSEIKDGMMIKKQVIVKEDIDTPDGIAIDWIHDHLYWTDTGLNNIQVSNLEGDKKATIIDNDLDEPRGIALDPIHGYVVNMYLFE